METITIDDIKTIIQSNYNEEEKNIALYNEVLAIITKFDGQKPTKRIATAFQKLHPDYTVYWRVEYGMYHLDIWGGNSGFEYQHHPSMLIAYDTHPVVEIERFKEHSTCYGEAAIERNKLRQAMLANNDQLTTIAQAINDYNKAHDQIVKTIDYPMPDQYDIEKLAKNYRKY